MRHGLESDLPRLSLDRIQYGRPVGAQVADHPAFCLPLSEQRSRRPESVTVATPDHTEARRRNLTMIDRAKMIREPALAAHIA